MLCRHSSGYSTFARSLIFVSLFLTLSSCGSLTAYKVGEVDYGSEQRAAAIIMGDPQVYSRASLINDRRREVEYLQRLLENSAVDASGKSVVSFSPQIIRDLKTIEVLSASLGLSFGQSIDSATTATGLADQIEVAKLEAQLAVLQKQIEGIQAAVAPQVTIPTPQLSESIAPSGSTGTGPSIKQPDLTALQADIKAIQAELKAMPVISAVAPPSNTYQGLTDPRDDFTDRQAYRRDIRAAIAESQLDDEHDTGGNALYRLQFQATVLPRGPKSRQWGATTMEVKPPELGTKDVANLYFQWLRYLSAELSRSRRDDATWVSVQPNFDFGHYAMGIAQRGYFDIVDTYWRRDNGEYYCVDHVVAPDKDLKVKGGKLTINSVDYEKQATYAVPRKKFRDSNNQSICASYPVKAFATSLTPELVAAIHNYGRGIGSSTTPSSNLSFATSLDRLAANVERTLSKEGDGSLSSSSPEGRGDEDSAAAVERRDAQRIRQATIEEVKGLFSDVSTGLGPDQPIDIRDVPLEFCASILEAAACPTGTDRIAAGGVTGDSYSIKAYSVLPTELVQRLGVTTESTQSLQTALSVAAQLSASTSGGLGVGYLEQSDARAEALTRQPLVVGFSGTQTPKGSSFFGWLFGPRFAIRDSEKLDLEQTVRSYGVTADVSIPGWWTYVILQTRAAWVSNWAAPSVLSDDPNVPVLPVEKRVRVPVTASTYESLTNFIAAKELMQNSAIFASYVTPDVVSACASTVTFQIGGSNIWRADSILLGGAKAKSITVMPDMKGVAAEFDMSAVFGALAQSDNMIHQVPLAVSAAQGSASPLLIFLVGRRQTTNGVTSCMSPILLSTNVKALVPTTVVSWSPREICSDTKSFPLIVEGLALKSGFSAEATPFEGKDSQGDDFRQVLTLSRTDGSAVTPRTLPIALKYTVREPDTTRNDRGEHKIVPLSVAIKDCKAPAQNDSGKAALITTSVKPAKEQKIALVTAVPAGYAEIVIGVRVKTATNDVEWKTSGAINAVPGDKAEVTGVLDLTSLKGKEGEKLEVVVRIRPRPGVEWKVIEAERTLSLAAEPI